MLFTMFLLANICYYYYNYMLITFQRAKNTIPLKLSHLYIDYMYIYIYRLWADV